MKTSPLVEVTEKEWQSQVVELARALGYRLVYHTHNSRRSAHGFPDLVLVRDRVVFLELKREKGKLTPEQVTWLRGLRKGGGHAYVARPSQLQLVASVLSEFSTADFPSAAVIRLADATERELETATP